MERLALILAALLAVVAAVVALVRRLSPQFLPLLVVERPRVRLRQQVVVAVVEVAARLAQVGVAAELLRGLPRPVFRPLLQRRVEGAVAAEVVTHRTLLKSSAPSWIRVQRWLRRIASIKWSRKRM